MAVAASAATAAVEATTAAVAPNEGDSCARLARLLRAVENKGTTRHRDTVVAQFNAFLGEGRVPTAELYLEFMTSCIEAKKEDGTPKYVASSHWSRRSHLLKYFRMFLRPPLDVSAVDKHVCDALKALSRIATPSHAREFKSSDLFDFWARAPNQGEWLLYKAISLVGFYGLARNCELVDLTWDDTLWNS